MDHNRYHSGHYPHLKQQAVRFVICVETQLPPELADWFSGMTIQNLETGHCLLTGCLVDQSALFGVLLRIRDLGIPLISVNPLE